MEVAHATAVGLGVGQVPFHEFRAQHPVGVLVGPRGRQQGLAGRGKAQGGL